MGTRKREERKRGGRSVSTDMSLTDKDTCGEGTVAVNGFDINKGESLRRN